jgi:hypothetical protein
MGGYEHQKETEMTRLENAIEMSEHDVQYECGRLSAEARHLSEKMAQIAKRAEEIGKTLPTDDHGKHYSPFNLLGEVQGLGGDVDRLCATVHAKVEKLNTLKYVAKEDK